MADNPETLDEVIDETHFKMEEAIEHLKMEFGTVRTGRANPQLVEKLSVDYYGAPTPLNSLASISVPEPRLLVISPFDKSSISAIEKAIQGSDLGITPGNDGNVIRLSFPQLTEERRREMVKVVKKHAEKSRVQVRDIRHRARKSLEALGISKDDLDRAEKDLDKHTKDVVGQIDDLLEHKEKELLSV